MKKIIVAAMLMAGAYIANAGTTNTRTDRETRKQLRKERRERRNELWLHSVNGVMESQFYADFPNASNVSWTQGAFAEATFTDNEVVKTAYYDEDNELVGTTSEIDYSLLPESARRNIDKEYKDYKVDKVILFDDNEANDTSMLLFDNSFGDQDTYFPVLSNGSKKIILKVTMEGEVSFFKNYR